jgi:hypothetical protein
VARLSSYPPLASPPLETSDAMLWGRTGLAVPPAWHAALALRRGPGQGLGIGSAAHVQAGSEDSTPSFTTGSSSRETSPEASPGQSPDYTGDAISPVGGPDYRTLVNQ